MFFIIIFLNFCSTVKMLKVDRFLDRFVSVLSHFSYDFHAVFCSLVPKKQNCFFLKCPRKFFRGVLRHARQPVAHVFFVRPLCYVFI